MALGHQLADHGLKFHRYIAAQGLAHALEALFVLPLADLGHGGDRYLLGGRVNGAADVPHAEELPAAAAQRDGGARLAGAPRAADAVHVDIAVLGQVVVDHVVDVVHVDAPGRHVGGHQYRDAGRLEALHHPGALALVHVAVDALAGKAAAVQVGGDLVHHQLGVAEDHRAHRLAGAQQQVQRVQLAAHGHLHELLADLIQRHLVGVDLDQLRVAHVFVRQLQYHLGHGGGEQHGLARLRHVIQDGLDVLPEAHAQHLVRLVQHHQLHVGKGQRAPAHVVHHAPRRADDQIGPPQLEDLPVDGRAAVHVRRPDVQGVADQLFDLIAALLGQLAGGAEDQHLHGGLRLRAVDHLHRGYGKGHGLARAGLTAPDHIRAASKQRYGLTLDLGRFGKAHGLNGAQQLGAQLKRLKVFHHFTSSSAICTALVAAPLRIWSPQHHRDRPLSSVRSSRMRPTNTMSWLLVSSGIG